MPTTIKAHKIRLNPTPEQADYLRRAAGSRRFIYNWLRHEAVSRAVDP